MDFHKNLNFAFGGGLLGAAIMSFIAPKALALLFTPPVSFGLNCEPVGTWSMQKLIITQVVGLVLGIAVTFFVKHKLFGNKGPK